MKTSMAYRLFRLYFNSNYENHEIFGNRVHNPLNGTQTRSFWANNTEVLLRGSAVIALGVALMYAFLNS
jgi:hypothetical protein